MISHYRMPLLFAVDVNKGHGKSIFLYSDLHYDIYNLHSKNSCIRSNSVVVNLDNILIIWLNMNLCCMSSNSIS